MADRLEDLLRACTVRVLGGPAAGAGFFVAPGHVLTCAHVTGEDDFARDNSAPLMVRWERDGHDPAEIPVTGPALVLPSRGRPIPALTADYPDIALLRVNGLGAHPCVPLDGGWPEPQDGFQVFGYPSEGGAVLLTPARLTYRGTHGTAPVVFFDLGSDTIKPGMSGAALLNLRTGAVCGIVTATKHPERPDGALAVPWAQIAADLSDIAVANRTFHDTDRRWGQARRLTASRPPVAVPPPGAGSTAPAETPTHAEVVIEATLANGTLESATWVAGSQVCRRSAPLPAEVAGVWSASAQPELLAGEQLAVAGRRLATALLDDDTERLLAGLITRLRPGGSAEVTFSLGDEALSLPTELLRLSAGPGADTGPLALLPAVSVCRRIRASASLDDRPALGAEPPAGTAGPLKILAAVAAPDETKTRNVPLDTEAEMQAVIDAVTTVAGGGQAQVKILEVASLPAIRQALAQDAYHVLHLSAHGSAQVVELEDEDGAPAAVMPRELITALQHAGRPVPLIVLSSCSGGSSGSQAMAAALVTQGADRVIAMLAPVTDTYATTLARHLYAELTAHPQLTAGLALARARYLAEEHRSQMPSDKRPPAEYGTPTLLTASGDSPLINPALPPAPLTAPTTPPSGTGVRALPMGALIGRRQQLRDAMAALRRTPAAVEKFGATSGVVLTGVGGIGKTALAGRIISRLRDDGWLIAVHEGRWNPTALITAVTQAIAQARAAGQPGTRGGELGTAQAADQPGARGELDAALAVLASPDIDDGPKLAAIAALLASARLLVVFDDFEQNLTTGGAFLDPAIADAITTLTDNAATGALLVTSRYPLPGPDLFLAEIPIPPLSPAELRRLFLRLPALRDLSPADRRLVTATIGGHPRLIEFTDALLRRGHASMRHIQVKLRDLATRHGINPAATPSLGIALNQVMLLGSADILLAELLALLTPRQAAILTQVAISRTPMTLDDLAHALDPAHAESVDELGADVRRLADLTLLAPSTDVLMHPWTAELVSRNVSADPAPLHERALAMRLRRFELGRAGYGDLTDIPRHLAALHRYDNIADVASQAVGMLDGTMATVAYLAEIRPLIPRQQHAWILVADLETQALLNAGDLTAAGAQLRAIHDQVQARAAADPANADWQRDLSVSYERLGDLAQAEGDLPAARTHYQASLDIAARLTAADPANAGWQRDLSVSHSRLGDLAQAEGDLPAARTHYQASLDIAARLAAADPANAGWQRDLSVSHIKLGDLAQAEGDLPATRTHYQASLDIAARLTAADPANAGWQRDLSSSLEKLGDLAQAEGDLTAARTRYQASLDIAARLTAADPSNALWQRDLAFIKQRLDDLATE